MKLRDAAVCAAVLIIFGIGWALSSSGGQKQGKTYSPKIAPASKEGERAIAGFRYPEGLKVELVAAEPLLANPVAFWIDERGRFYVAETFRLHAGVTDNRNHRYWLNDDLSARTVADRVAMYKKHLKNRFETYATEHDRVRLLEDSNGDGRPDKATVFADGFHQAADGIGSGVLSRGNKVWYTCIPDLWLLEDNNGDGKADTKKSLSSGYGVHVSFLGHDLHGLKFGPDGKLYFSVGDRGLHVEQEGKLFHLPDTGAVLRCNPDGSELEIVASGMRNPQELAFDKFGNLFTGDNNADSGDQARWVHVVEGGDSGWRIGYQYLNPPPARLGPWNAEKLWHLQHADQPAYVLPPLAHVVNGPSGLTYHPGVSLLPEKYKDHFFLCDFHGAAHNSGVHAYRIVPKGSSFEVVDGGPVIENVLATDVDFGPDGGLYLTDWVTSWGLTGKGRIYKIHDPARLNDHKVAEVAKLIAEGMEKRSNEELAKLLGHLDMRIRQEAQFELASRGENATSILTKVAGSDQNLLARVHAIWGLGQIASNKNASKQVRQAALKPVVAMTGDKDDEIRVQCAKVLGWSREKDHAEKLIPLLKDSSIPVRFQAALSLAKMGSRSAIEPLVAMLRENNDADVYLRHAGVMGLVGSADVKELMRFSKDESPAVRRAIVLALRREAMPEYRIVRDDNGQGTSGFVEEFIDVSAIADFLNDADPSIVREAALAIHDVPIPAAMPKLAELAERSGLPDAVVYRALNAHFYLGKKDNAFALANYAAKTNAPEAKRVEAIRHLENWQNPSNLDRVLGIYRPVEHENPAVAVEALRSVLGGVFAGPNRVRLAATKAATKLGIKGIGPELLAIVRDKDAEAVMRAESLKALDSLRDERLKEAIEIALDSDQGELRAAARSIIAKREPEKALPLLQKALENGKTAEKRAALADLGKMKNGEGDEVLAQWMDSVLGGTLAPELRLDVLQAAWARNSTKLSEKLRAYEESLSKDDPLSKYRIALHGGDAEAGRRIFHERTDLSCVRCHKINGTGGDVGPDLTKIGKEQKRDYLLEALVTPSKQIAKGYDSVLLILNNGLVKTGILKSENATSVQLMTAEGTLVTVEKSDIAERAPGRSAMPDDLMQHLSLMELRDLLEYLASLR